MRKRPKTPRKRARRNQRIKRRDFLRRAGAASAALALSGPLGCATQDDVLPSYEYDGPLGPATTFEHGVASGDPTEDSVILWTRAKSDTDEDVDVFWELAYDEAFDERIAAAWATATTERDHTIKVDAAGLPAGTPLYYRFFALGRESPVGRTKTAPRGDVAHLRFAVVSCSSYAHGWFHAYGHIAERDDLDAVVHLGDYIYEYGSGEYGTERACEPAHEILTLEDYRTRYSQYRRDPQLQAVHRMHPMIAVWDDHEVANDTWREGAGNHDPDTEGSFAERAEAGHRAYSEWMPIRDQSASSRIYRTLRYGSLVDLFMLDTRFVGRDEQIGNSSDSMDESRSLLGEEQEAWLESELLSSTARWKVLGQQVVMAHLGLSENLHVTFDQWDGYDAARRRLLGFIRDEGIENVVVLTGDSHMSWANDLLENPFDRDIYDPETGAGSVAVEIATPAVSSPAALGFGVLIDDTLEFFNRHIRRIDMDHRGYVLLDIDDARVQADWFHLDGVKEDEGEASFAFAFEVRSGVPHLVEVDDPVSV
jgi:alkaline phosphatase D